MAIPSKQDSAPQAFNHRNGGILNGSQANGIPIKEDYQNEEDWRIGCYRRFYSKTADRQVKKQAMIQAAIQMYTAVTDSSELPTYATVPGSDVAVSSVPYEHMNPLFAPMRKRVGVFKQTEVIPNIKITNKSAKSRKQEMYQADIMSRAMGDNMPAIEELSGMPMPNPQAEMQAQGFSGPFEEYMEKGYRDYWEHRAEKLLNDWLDQSEFKSTLDQQYMYYVLTQTVVFWPRINPMTKQVEVYVEDPTQILYDMDMQDQHGRDMQWAIRYRYVSENELLHQYSQLDREEIRDYRNSNAPGAFSSILPAWKEVDTTIYYLVTECRWIYTEEISVEDAKRNTDMDMISVNPETPEKDLRYEEVYYTIIIGHYKELEGGRMPNQVRSVDITSKGNLGVFVLSLDHFLDPLAPTNTLRVQSYIRLRNMLFFKLTQLVADIKGVYVEVDVSLLPEAQDGQPDTKQFMEDMMGNKIVFKDSTQGGMLMDQPVGLRGQDVTTIKEAGLPRDVPVLINMINEVSMQINSMLSINDSSLGTVGQYQNATTASMNLNAYQAAIEYEDKEFFTITQRTLTYVANLQKILDVVQDANHMKYDNSEAIDAVVIRNGDEYLEVDPEGFLFQDIGLSLTIQTNSIEQRARLNQYILAGMQQGSVSLEEAIEFESADSVSDGIYSLKLMLARKRREQAAAAQQQQQMQMQQQQQMMQEQMQAQMAMEQQKIKSELEADMTKQEQKKALELKNSNINTANNNAAQAAAMQARFEQDMIKEQLSNSDKAAPAVPQI